jgi:two-component system alkaline phosphatase synthesis response regulator PhoP
MKQTPKILVVDDEETIREVFSSYLCDEGFQVKAAASGLEALELIEEERFDFLLIDLIMPEMDGLELLSRVREKGIDVPAAVLTAYEIELDKDRENFLKIRDFIPKGISMAEVSEKIKDIIKGGQGL